MRNKLLLTAMLVVPAFAAVSEELDSNRAMEFLREADGSVTVLLADEINATFVDALSHILLESTASNVRFGIAEGLEGREEMIGILNDKFADRSGWVVCERWLTEEGFQDRMAGELVNNYSGSLVVIDNGENDRERFHPAIGEDPWMGAGENPILFGLFSAETPLGLIEDAERYRAAWQVIDGMAHGVNVNGC